MREKNHTHIREKCSFQAFVFSFTEKKPSTFFKNFFAHKCHEKYFRPQKYIDRTPPHRHTVKSEHWIVSLSQWKFMNIEENINGDSVTFQRKRKKKWRESYDLWKKNYNFYSTEMCNERLSLVLFDFNWFNIEELR